MKKKIIAISQARLSSSRFPQKILQTIDGQTLIDLHLSRVKQSKLIDQVVLAIAQEEGAEKILQGIEQKESFLYRFGSVEDVLDRYYQACLELEADYIVRVTSDCPLIDPELIDKVIEFALEGDYDYVSNALEPTFPDGVDTEVFKKEVLVKAWKEAVDPKDREHVTPFIWRNFFTPTHPWKIGSYKGTENLSHFRLTLDYKEDYDLLKKVIHVVGKSASYIEYVNYLKMNPGVYKMNAKYIRNEGF